MDELLDDDEVEVLEEAWSEIMELMVAEIKPRFTNMEEARIEMMELMAA